MSLSLMLHLSEVSSRDSAGRKASFLTKDATSERSLVARFFLLRSSCGASFF